MLWLSSNLQNAEVLGKMKHYQKEIIALENEELKSLTSDVSLYVRLMAYYLVQDNMSDVKLLWSRIPASFKTNTQLQQLDILMQALTTRNLSLFYNNISNCDWTEDIKTVVEDLKKNTREKVLQLIANAYTSILEKNLVELTNFNENELKQMCLERNWSFESDGEQLIIHPKRQVFHIYNTSESEYQLSKLTEFVSFLEN